MNIQDIIVNRITLSSSLDRQMEFSRILANSISLIQRDGPSKLKDIEQLFLLEQEIIGCKFNLPVTQSFTLTCLFTGKASIYVSNSIVLSDSWQVNKSIQLTIINSVLLSNYFASYKLPWQEIGTSSQNKDIELL